MCTWNKLTPHYFGYNSSLSPLLMNLNPCKPIAVVVFSYETISYHLITRWYVYTSRKTLLGIGVNDERRVSK